MEAVYKFNDWLNGIVWGPWMLVILVGTGVYLTVILCAPQLRYFGIVWKEVFGKRARTAHAESKSISSFAAMATAMAATVGTGNIAGVATALHLGGPGAMFWMLVSAFFGMCTKFGEIVLAVHFREKDEHGDWRGGTMYILEKGLVQEKGDSWKPVGKALAVLFAIFTFFASFGIGSAVQANSTAEGLKLGFNIDPLYSGIGMAILVGLVIIGGLKSLSTVTTYIVPFMAVFYIVGAIVVLALHIDLLGQVIVDVVTYAFKDPMALPGALAGWSVRVAITKGIARGVFSNEAGLGSAPMVHATANVDHPVRQGLYGIFEVFMDTFIICSMTALVVMGTDTLTGQPGLTGAQLSLFAFESVIGSFGKYILSIALALFAFTTILGWYWYAETAMVYLFGVWFKPLMKVVCITLVFVGAAGSEIFGTGTNEFLSHLWDMGDTLNGLMAIPNLIGLLLLSGVIRRLVKDFDAKRRSGELKI
ncbi:MAG: sodium:alanine symporter family protein [Synergistaceae bacterium]|jgi:AGCS family alanine or glycine:cation symporter|nr:sodium:alanine symporter family protein [Synergistaceae bacterium]